MSVIAFKKAECSKIFSNETTIKSLVIENYAYQNSILSRLTCPSEKRELYNPLSNK